MYKIALILNYLEDVGQSYSYHEMMDIFGYSFVQLQELLEYIRSLNLITLKGYYKVTEEGYNLLNSYGLTELDFEEFIEGHMEDDIFIEEKLNINEVYIPKKFEKKYKKS